MKWNWELKSADKKPLSPKVGNIVDCSEDDVLE